MSTQDLQVDSLCIWPLIRTTWGPKENHRHLNNGQDHGRRNGNLVYIGALRERAYSALDSL